MRTMVANFEFEGVVTEIPITQDFHAVAWTSETKLVYIYEDVLRSIDLVSGERHDIAQIHPETFWWIAGSEATC